MVVKEEYRRFNCYRYKVLTNIVYGYNENDKLIYSSCSLKEEKHCDGYESPQRKCPYYLPHLLTEDV